MQHLFETLRSMTFWGFSSSPRNSHGSIYTREKRIFVSLLLLVLMISSLAFLSLPSIKESNMTLEITVFDTDRDVVGVIDSAVSLIWTERLRTPGDFELVLTPTQENIDLMTLDNYISIPESDDWMIVESVSIRTDAEEGDTLIASGRSLLSLWDRRQQYQNGGWGCGGTIPGCSINAVLSFMQLYGFGSADADREVTYMKVGYSTDPRLTNDAAYYIEWSQDFRKGSEDRNILDTIVTMAEAYGVGITMYPDLDTGDLYIHPFLGQDRTTDQVDNPVVIFSPELGNLVNSEVLITKQGYRTFVYIWGAPEPTPQPMYDQELSPKVTGLSRREYWWDGSSLIRPPAPCGIWLPTKKSPAVPPRRIPPFPTGGST